MQRAAHCWPRAVAVRVSGITQVWQPIRAADGLTSLLTCICGSPRLLHRYTSVSDRCRCIAVRDNSHGIAREWTGCAGGGPPRRRRPRWENVVASQVIEPTDWPHPVASRRRGLRGHRSAQGSDARGGFVSTLRTGPASAGQADQGQRNRP